MFNELSIAIRSLRRDSGFTAIAVLTLALGVGTTTAVFSVIEAIVLRPLPYPEPDRLVDISHMTREGLRLTASFYDAADLRGATDTFEGVAFRASQPSIQILTAQGIDAFQASALFVSEDYLSLLGAEPFLGRNFVAEDILPIPDGNEQSLEERTATAVIVTYGLWQRAFGADSTLVGRTLEMDGQTVVVVGVLPQDFRLLHERPHRWVKGTSSELFIVIPDILAAGRPEGGQGRQVLILGRLHPGVTYERAQASVDAIVARLRDEIPQYADEQLRMPIYPIHRDMTLSARPIILVLAGGVAFLMLLVCANVANLMLVRGYIRSSEDAVRVVVGCGSWQLIRQKLTDSAVLAAAGGVLGVGLAWVAIRVVEILGPRTVPLLDRVELNLAALGFALGMGLVAVLLSGLLPALQVLRVDLVGILGSGGRGGSSRGRRKLMGVLVVSELALSMMLLSGAVVMVQSLVALTRARLGFDAENVITFDLTGFDERYREEETRRTFFRELDEMLASLPGVDAVGRTSMPPLSERVSNTIYGPTPEILEQRLYRADITMVNGNYFEAMGTRLLAGRFFDELELSERSESVIVGETLARRAWGGDDPIGQRIFFGGREGTVVGVVESMLMRDYGTIQLQAIHTPEVFPGSASTYVIRSGLEPESVAASIRSTVESLDPTLVPYAIAQLAERVSLARASTRFVMWAMGAFAVIALLVAVGGLFGVISYTVRTRTAELGIRIALGAEKRTILSMVLGQGAVLSLIGVAVGLAGTLLTARFVASLAYEVSATDPLTLAATAAVLALVAVLACYVPARWASSVEPATALRVK